MEAIVLQLLQSLQAAALLLYLRVVGQQPQGDLGQPYLLSLQTGSSVEEVLGSLQHHCP